MTTEYQMTEILDVVENILLTLMQSSVSIWLTGVVLTVVIFFCFFFARYSRKSHKFSSKPPSKNLPATKKWHKHTSRMPTMPPAPIDKYGKHTQSQPDSQKIIREQAGFGKLSFDPDRCKVCDRPVSEQVKKYCLARPHLFKGNVYCYKHQITVQGLNHLPTFKP
jgi:hypothetical protein